MEARARLSVRPPWIFIRNMCRRLLKTLIVARYRGRGRAVAEVLNAENIAKLANGKDDGVRSEVRMLKLPSARTQADCENAALAMLDDAGEPAWSGSYQIWSAFLPGRNPHIFPGDAIAVNAPSQEATSMRSFGAWKSNWRTRQAIAGCTRSNSRMMQQNRWHMKTRKRRDRSAAGCARRGSPRTRSARIT